MTFPIITDMDFGHTSPQFTLPLGCRARIDSMRAASKSSTRQFARDSAI